MPSSFVSLALALAIGCLTLTVSTPPAVAQDRQVGEASGLPLPRFVSLKSRPTNVRVGPSQSYEIAWVFERAGLPLEVIQEFDNWRRIRDPEGGNGWMHHSLLSGRRMAMVTPWEKDLNSVVEVYARATRTGRLIAWLQPGVIAPVDQCDGTSCRLIGDTWRGWVDQTKLWGVYPNEEIR